MSQNTTSSVRDFLPDNVFLNLEDDDNDTLDLVTDVNDSYYSSTNTDHLINQQFDLENLESAGDSDSDSGGEAEVGTVFERREDIAYSEDVSEFFRTGCGCQSVKGKKKKNLVFDIVWYVFVMKMSRKLLT